MVDATGFAAALRKDADDWDRSGALPEAVRGAVARAGIFGVGLPKHYGGSGGGPVEVGDVCVQLGGVCSALRGLLTVQEMVAAAVLRWGTAAQRELWLPLLAHGARFAAFAATEAGAGTDLAGVQTRIDEDGDELVVTGRKLWVTFGRTADVFLVLGLASGGLWALLVDGDRPGVRRQSVSGQLGMRAAEIAHVDFDGVRVSRDRAIGPPGSGLTHVVGTALDHGRHTVAWGCVGMAEVCVTAAADHAVQRLQRGVPLAEHQLVRAELARTAVRSRAARALCARAAELRAQGDPGALAETVVAKYAAADAATAVSAAAVQILGAAAIAPESLVGRFFRDAKVMELIEGSSFVSELHIGERLLRRHGFRPSAGDRAGARVEEGPR
ncbi:acyl-CoA dehydrogenase family protein [Streptomyces sp. NPDC047315]|uniref:acyl-CoA dehydrogenase family protein n=1 Tax=Streptomyces sp. NPDC047315 TaxID=3155142 RepID=UPI0033D062C4